MVFIISKACTNYETILLSLSPFITKLQALHIEEKFCQLSWHKLTSSLQLHTMERKGDGSDGIKEDSVSFHSCIILSRSFSHPH